MPDGLTVLQAPLVCPLLGLNIGVV